MSVFHRVDGFFLSHFEKWCHKLQRLTGKTNYYFLGMCGLMADFVLLGIYYNLFPEVLLKIGGKGLVVGTIATDPLFFWSCVILFLLYTLAWKVMEDRAYCRLSKGLANEKKSDSPYVYLRLEFMLLSLFAIFLFVAHKIAFYDLVFIILFCLSVFLHCCDPLPPCRGRIQSWVSSLGRKVVSSPVPLKAE